MRGELGGVGVVDGDGGVAVGGEGDGLIDELLGEVEGGEVGVTEFVHGDADAAGAATGFEQRGGLVGEDALDHDALAGPEAEPVGGLGVVDDGSEVVEIAADLRGGDGAESGGHGEEMTNDQGSMTNVERGIVAAEEELGRQERGCVGRWEDARLGGINA